MRQEFLLVSLTVDDEEQGPSEGKETLSQALSATTRGQQYSLILLYYIMLYYIMLCFML